VRQAGTLPLIRRPFAPTQARRRSRVVRQSARLALGVLVALLAALLGTAVFAIATLYRSAESRYVGQALPLRAATQDLVLQLVNEETAVRGYVITRDRASLRPYFAGRYAAANDLARLEQMARAHPELTARVRQLRAEIRSLEGWFAHQIVFVADGREGQLRAERNALGGQARFERFRRSAAAATADVNRLVAETRAQQRRTYLRTMAAVVAGGVGALAIALGLLVRVPERLRRLYVAEEEAREHAEVGANAARALEHIDEGVVLLDDRDSIRFRNAAAAEMFGAGEGAALVRDLALLEELAAEQALTPFELGGEERWLRVAVARFEGGRVLTFHDVTDEQRLERARNDLVATASHELRTPVAAVYGAAQTLRRQTGLAEEQRQALMQMIEQEAEQLTVLVEQLLTAAQLDRSALALVRRDCDLYALCAGVRRTAAASGSDVAVVLDAPAALAPIATDPQRLRQVLTNLVDNAVKYSPPGSTVKLRVVDEPHRVLIQVTDEGIGIPPEEQELVFEKFYRVDPEMTGGVGGSGLGLYISREIVERLGGRLSVHSDSGAGSTFTVELPRS
jgi:signal transduction histidine kinase